MSRLHPVFNVVKLLRAPEDPIPSQKAHPLPLPEMVDGEEHYVVERVLISRLMRGQLQFLVKWEGYGYEENSWIPESDIAAPDKIQEFYNAHPGAPRWIRSVAFHSLISRASRTQHARRGVMSGDDLFSAPKTSQSLSNSDLRHLRHSSDSDRLRVPETLWSTSYSNPHPALPNAPARSSHSDPSTNIPSDGRSETSASSEGNPETSLESALSDPKSALTFLGNSPSCSGDRAAPTASDIKGQWWSGSMGNAGRWP